MINEALSEHASRVQELSLFLAGVGAVFSVGIFAAMILFCLKYRRKSTDERGKGPRSHFGLETLWALIPFAIMLVMFFWGAQLYVEIFEKKNFSHNVTVMAKRWMWKFYHDQGPRQINELHVPVNQTSQLTLISQDVIHSFYVPDLKLKHDVLPGRYIKLYIHPTKTGVFPIRCAEYCGMNHSRMRAKLIVLNQDEFNQWQKTDLSLAPEVSIARGRQLFESYQCTSCHRSDSSQLAPSLLGLFGTNIKFKDGETGTVDEMYLRESILTPQSKIREGYPAAMPSFAGQLEEEQLTSLIQYIKSLQNEVKK